MSGKKRKSEKKKEKEDITKLPLTHTDRLKIKQKKRGKSTKPAKTQARYEEIFSVTRQLIRQGEIKNEKQAAEALSKVTDYSKKYIRYELLRKKAPEDIKRKLNIGVEEKKKESKEKKSFEEKKPEKRAEGKEPEIRRPKVEGPEKEKPKKKLFEEKEDEESEKKISTSVQIGEESSDVHEELRRGGDVNIEVNIDEEDDDSGGGGDGGDEEESDEGSSGGGGGIGFLGSPQIKLAIIVILIVIFLGMIIGLLLR